MRLALPLALIIISALARPAWPDRLGLAAGYFPEQWGNPFSSTSITRQPLWSALFDPLTLVTADGELLPWLATSWTRESQTEWRIELRPGISFANGEPFNADSVVAAVNYLAGSAGRTTPVGRELTGLVAAHVIDPLTALLQTETPDPLLPYKLALLRPLAAKTWADVGPEEYFTNPTGTGPYTVDDIGPTRATLTASPISWRRAPTETLDYLVLLEPASRQAALATGQADVAITALSPDEFDSIRAQGGAVFIDRIPAVVTLSYATVGRDTPFADQRVREAMIYAVNRDAIVSILLGGTTRVANQPATSVAFGYANDMPTRPFDPDRARSLLKEAGYADGFSFSLDLPSGAALYTDVFQQIAADLALIGVDVTIQLIPQSRFLQNVQTGDWAGDAMAMPMFTPIGDALYPMRQNSCQWHAAYYCDPVAVPLIENAISKGNIEERKIATQAVMRHAHATAQSLYLYETVSFIGLSARVKKFRSDYGFIRYETIELKN